MVFMITVRNVNGNHLRHNSCRESVTKCFERKGNLMPASDIGIDLGTRNSQVYSTGRGLVVSEPSVVVYDKNSEKIKAIGEEARQMTGHVSSNMEVNLNHISLLNKSNWSSNCCFRRNMSN